MCRNSFVERTALIGKFPLDDYGLRNFENSHGGGGNKSLTCFSVGARSSEDIAQQIFNCSGQPERVCVPGIAILAIFLVHLLKNTYWFGNVFGFTCHCRAIICVSPVQYVSKD